MREVVFCNHISSSPEPTGLASVLFSISFICKLCHYSISLIIHCKDDDDVIAEFGLQKPKDEGDTEEVCNLRYLTLHVFFKRTEHIRT